RGSHSGVAPAGGGDDRRRSETARRIPPRGQRQQGAIRALVARAVEDRRVRAAGEAMKRVAAVLAALAVLHGARAAAPEESRLALVIGNAAYSMPDAKLANAANDARLVAETLRDLGFRVRLLEDADHAAMRRTIREFEDEVRHEGGVAFLYFAGHGAQLEG